MDKYIDDLTQRELRHSTKLSMNFDKWKSMIKNENDVGIVLEELKAAIYEHGQIGKELLHLGHLIKTKDDK